MVAALACKALSVRGGTEEVHRRGRGRGRGACRRKARERRRTRARESSGARRRLGPRRGRRGRPARRAAREIRPKQRGGGTSSVPQRFCLSVDCAEPPTDPTFRKKLFRTYICTLSPGGPPAARRKVLMYAGMAIRQSPTRGFPEVFPARARHSGGVMVLARPKCAIFGQLPCF